MNEASAKYAILLGAWHNGLIAAPEVKIIGRVRLDVALLSDERGYSYRMQREVIQ